MPGATPFNYRIERLHELPTDFRLIAESHATDRQEGSDTVRKRKCLTGPTVAVSMIGRHRRGTAAASFTTAGVPGAG